MPKFRYTAKDKEARLFTGVIEGKDNIFVVRELKRRNLTIISVQEEHLKAAVRRGKEKVRPMDLVIFSRQLATLIDSGISLVMGLTILQEQIENPFLKKVVANIRSDIEAGNSLSSSFAKYPDAFPEIFTNMTKAGESSGNLNEILERVADYLERTENIRRKLVSSMTYPVVIMGMAVLVVTFLMLKVVPAFKNIFVSLGGTLPLPTLILIQISNYSLKLFPLIVGAIILAYMGFMRYIGTEEGRLKFDQVKLKLPVFGPIFRNVAISKFTRTLATLVKSGVSILEAFEISGKVSGNKVIENATNQIRMNLQSGESISDPMAETGKFPVFVVKMIAVGEQTGELEKMLTKVSDYYEEQINETLGSLTSLLEPFIIVFLGLIIGYIVLAMFLPIFKLTQTMGH
jgi:type IV pilus assembly protein PilC